MAWYIIKQSDINSICHIDIRCINTIWSKLSICSVKINLLHNKLQYINGGQTTYVIANGTYKSVLLRCDEHIFNCAISSSLKFKGL